jgi:hypothetical protein
VFVALNVIPRQNVGGQSLLRCLRSYSIVDLYLALEVHTEQTIDAGRRELANFALHMKVSNTIKNVAFLEALFIGGADKEFIRHSQNSSGDEASKNWSFPKMHALVHSFDDIREKGASRNYNTKPNEKLHGPLKKSYLLRTNFRDVAPQVRLSSLCVIALMLLCLDLKGRTFALCLVTDNQPN